MLTAVNICYICKIPAVRREFYRIYGLCRSNFFQGPNTLYDKINGVISPAGEKQKTFSVRRYSQTKIGVRQFSNFARGSQIRRGDRQGYLAFARPNISNFLADWQPLNKFNFIRVRNKFIG